MDQCFIDRVYEGFEYERSRKEPPADFPVLPLIPGGRYTDPDFLELEQKFLWKKSWLYACHSNELPHKGSYILWNKTGSPILIVRGEDDQVRAFYNTCRHRGGPLVTASSGKVSGGLTCIYHSWSYDLEGNLRGVPDRRGFSDLNYQERRIYHWHEELDRRIGVEHIPEQLRVAPRLSGMIERSSSEN